MRIQEVLWFLYCGGLGMIFLLTFCKTVYRVYRHEENVMTPQVWDEKSAEIICGAIALLTLGLFIGLGCIGLSWWRVAVFGCLGAVFSVVIYYIIEMVGKITGVLVILILAFLQDIFTKICFLVKKYLLRKER